MRKLGLMCVLGLVAGNALAVPVTWLATGTIVLANGGSAMPLPAQVGDAFWYSVTFDNETPDIYESPYAGEFRGAIQSVVFSTGGQDYAVPFDSNYSFAYSYNDSFQDYYQLSFQTSTVAPGQLPQMNSHFSLSSTSPLALDTDQFPDAPPSDLSLYQAGAQLSFYEANSSWTLYGQVLNIEQQPVSVPEPSTALIFAAGLAATGLARRKRQA